MSDVKHTAGPWSLSIPRDASDAVVSGPASWRREGDQIAELVRIRRHAPHLTTFGGEQEANARLIAAAPDLLAVAKRIEAAMDFDASDHPMFQGMQAQLLAAIAKASGETP